MNVIRALFYPYKSGNLFCLTNDNQSFPVATNGKHLWVPKDVIDAAEKHAKVCSFSMALEMALYIELH